MQNSTINIDTRRQLENSQCQVHKFYRVCGHKLNVYNSGIRESLTKYNCAAFSVELWTCFAIDITIDIPSKHAMSRVQETAVKKIAYNCMVKPYNWLQHCPSTCKVNIFT